ncbi:nitroreductase/quinone reductase family protein [Microbacterium kribbense]|uniref:nitroreductase/quinone reductase family protein n=1 Tax=Microbacterium kribbense TaxID=433645 RepID=UPI0031DD20B1
MAGQKDWTQQIIDEFREHDGTVTLAPFGRHLVLLHHVGAKSGTARVTPVRSIRTDDDTWLIAASKAGAPVNPGWYHNLLAHPDITIEVPGEGEVAVHVDELTGAARDAGWAQFTSQAPGFQEYEKKTTRVIPVLALHRRG